MGKMKVLHPKIWVIFFPLKMKVSRGTSHGIDTKFRHVLCWVISNADQIPDKMHQLCRQEMTCLGGSLVLKKNPHKLGPLPFLKWGYNTHFLMGL